MAVVGMMLGALGVSLVPTVASAVKLPRTPAAQPAVASGTGIATPHRVSMRAIAQTSPVQSRAVVKPFLTPDPARVAAAKASPHGVTANRTAPVSRAAGFQGGSTVAGFAGPFAGVSHDLQLGSGLDGDIEPPDTQLAAGPQFLIEMVNSTVEVLDKSGNVRGSPITIESFFAFAQTAQAGEVGTDPRVYFDQSTGRFFATELGFQVTSAGVPVSGTVLAAVSIDSNPFDGFLIYQIYAKPNALCDQPVLGITGDKVSVGCTEFANVNGTAAFTDGFFFVLNKSEMLSGSSLDFHFFFSSGWASLTPTLTLNPNGALQTAAIATYNRALLGTSGQIGVVALTGLPPGTVTATEVDLTMASTAVPPPAQQLGDGTTGSIDTGDDRFLSSAWEGNRLWVGGNNACLDSGTPVSCLKLVEVDTSAWDPNAGTGAPTVAQDLSIIAGGGFHRYYPAVSLNSGGDPYVEFSESSTTTPVSLGAITIPQCGSNFANNVVQPFFFLQGNGQYHGSRWGDYSGAAIEPNDPNKLWLTGEYTAGSGTRQWGTATAEAPISTAVDASRPYTGGSDAIGVGAGSTDWFFAEGFTGQNFDEFLTVQNPGAAQTMCVDYLLTGGNVISRSYNLAAASRTTLRVNDEILPGQSVSMHVHAPNPIVAERPMYFDFNGLTGGDDVMGATSLGSTFYFAEGFTGANFDEFLTLMNTDPSATSNVNVTYFFGGGAPPKTVAHPVGPHSRVTVFVNDPAEAGPGQNVSMLVQVTSGPNILAERPMYFNFNGWTGGHVAIGASGLSTHVDLAEGFVANNFDEFLTILNPNASAANLTITYNLAGGGTPVVETMTVPANSRGTRLVNSDLPGGTSASVHVDSNVGVVVERPMYFDFNGWTGGHDAVAVDSSTLGSTYNFAEGFVSNNFDEFLTVENNNATSVTINITYFLTSGGTVTEAPVTIPAHSRYTRFVNGDFTGAVSQSVQVTSTGGNVLVERPMYFAF